MWAETNHAIFGVGTGNGGRPHVELQQNWSILSDIKLFPVKLFGFAHFQSERSPLISSAKDLNGAKLQSQFSGLLSNCMQSVSSHQTKSAGKALFSIAEIWLFDKSMRSIDLIPVKAYAGIKVMALSLRLSLT